MNRENLKVGSLVIDDCSEKYGDIILIPWFSCRSQKEDKAGWVKLETHGATRREAYDAYLHATYNPWEKH